MPVIIPPIKSQGIKTKLVPWINDLILTSGVSLTARWIEPFFGTGVVGFNCPIMGTHIVGDPNPHKFLPEGTERRGYALYYACIS